MTDTPKEDIVQAAKDNGIDFTYNRDRGWYWAHSSYPSLLNGPFETDLEAAEDYVSNAAPDDEPEDTAGPRV